MEYVVRELLPEDDKRIEKVIRQCLIEFGGNHEGTAWTDPNLGRFSRIYCTPGNKYWVATDADGNIVGGAGIGNMDGTERICELQKMYCLPAARGSGISHRLMETALAYAKGFYAKCYLETLENMTAAQRFYEKYGFRRIAASVGQTGHFACDVRYIKDL
ncbi:MAG: GNAT family N-acetyltransferase [Schwartzia sp.]|nr:GNAT family N-acetyltransferase [Schwartzia sp. (in: firmicutes)]